MENAQAPSSQIVWDLREAQLAVRDPHGESLKLAEMKPAELVRRLEDIRPALRTPLWLRFSVHNLSEFMAEEFSRLEKIVFREWHVQQSGTPLDVEVRRTPRFGSPR